MVIEVSLLVPSGAKEVIWISLAPPLNSTEDENLPSLSATTIFCES